MKLTLALLATLLGVGLAEGNGNGPLDTMGSIEASLPRGVKTGGDVRSKQQASSSTVVKPTASKPLPGTEEAIELFKPETILADILSLIEDPKAEVELNEFLAEVQTPEFMQQVVEKPEVAEETFQKFLKITQNPALQKAVEKFAEKPAVQQCIAAVAQEMEIFAEEILADSILGALDAFEADLYQPVVIEFASFPLMDTVELPENIAALEKEKYHGNLFEALGLHNSIFASEEALKFVLKQDVAAARGEDAAAVFNYLKEGDNAKRYHELMTSELDSEGKPKMTLPQREGPKIEEVHDTEMASEATV